MQNALWKVSLQLTYFPGLHQIAPNKKSTKLSVKDTVLIKGFDVSALEDFAQQKVPASAGFQAPHSFQHRKYLMLNLNLCVKKGNSGEVAH